MFFNDNCKLLRKKIHFTRLVIQKHLLFEVGFNKFASKMKKICIGGYLFAFMGIKRQRTTN